MKNISVEIINQLSDNYCYLISKENYSSTIIIDPAESKIIVDILKKRKLNLDYIFITHHHKDHTSGVFNLLKEYPKVKIFSPSNLYSIPINLITDGDTIQTSINKFEIISAPGHTLDHVVLCDNNNHLLFVGDVLFRLGCGRVFEGTYEQMHTTLNKLCDLSDKFTVYCGHEYTLNNLKFLENIFNNNSILQEIKIQIKNDLNTKGRSIPFNLGNEKKCNPFFKSKQ